MDKVLQEHPRCFIYGLVDPATKLVFYVGLSTRGLTRPSQHRQKGWAFEVAILEVVDDPAAPSGCLCPWLPTNRNPTLLNELERYWVALGRAFGWQLRNKTDGGDGMRVRGSPATRARMSAAQLGRRHDPETRHKISVAIKARMQDPAANVGNAGKKKPKRARAPKPLRPRDPNAYRWSATRKEAQRVAMLGHSVSKETRAKTSATLRARFANDARMQERLACFAEERRSRTHCKRGHALTADNLVKLTTRRYRVCLTCAREKQRAARLRAKPS